MLHDGVSGLEQYTLVITDDQRLHVLPKASYLVDNVDGMVEHHSEIQSPGGILHHRLAKHFQQNARLLFQCRYVHLDTILHIIFLDLKDLISNTLKTI